MTSSKKIRILIADDHFVVAHGLSSILSSQDDFKIVGTASDGEEAIALYTKHQPDVLLLDLRMPKKDGVAVVRELMCSQKGCRIIIMTTYAGEEDVKQCIKGGASGYLLKDAGSEAIIEAVREVHAGGRFLPKELAEKLAFSLSQPALTAREAEVLELLSIGRSNRDIGLALRISESTVKCHVTSILNKLDALNRTEAIVIATQRGLLKT